MHGHNTDTTFQYEVESSEDENKWKVTTITCHDRLVSDNEDQIKELVKPLISEGGHIVIDFADLKYLGSLGLGALVGLKVFAIHKGFCKLELVNLSPRVRELLRPDRPDGIVLPIRAIFPRRT